MEVEEDWVEEDWVEDGVSNQSKHVTLGARYKYVGILAGGGGGLGGGGLGGGK